MPESLQYYEVLPIVFVQRVDQLEEYSTEEGP